MTAEPKAHPTKKGAPFRGCPVLHERPATAPVSYLREPGGAVPQAAQSEDRGNAPSV